MSDTVKVIIQAEAAVKFKKTVEMKKADYDKYLEVCEEWQSDLEVEGQIKEIANKYGFFGDGEDIEDIGEPEDIEFELVK
ncbi:hypothetical protein DY703_14610 [Salmonella enterica]|uniref:hypothetical protein n=1 Tax=Salmonella enterica TaxID=28901 RepID=UPI0012D63FC1|nr:hypothetical protein [Salmonella enterica]EBQ9005164.1 hypothetical protein [Salmonella enterica subsp. enterica serovar Blockley]ECD6162192.1 hypothetical protein [Salmonella enterica subsp. enterica]ECU7995340.1 hypothetical protein [Salmonella enterica subsp. enterica serovar Toucra]EAW3045232.1 hypothetical protein [Salmonella enterica]